MTFKYAVHPGPVRSKEDGDWHFVGFLRLCQLYQVNPNECLDVSNHIQLRGWSAETLAGLIQLRPSRNGHYGRPG